MILAIIIVGCFWLACIHQNLRDSPDPQQSTTYNEMKEK